MKILFKLKLIIATSFFALFSYSAQSATALTSGFLPAQGSTLQEIDAYIESRSQTTLINSVIASGAGGACQALGYADKLSSSPFTINGNTYSAYSCTGGTNPASGMAIKIKYCPAGQGFSLTPRNATGQNCSPCLSSEQVNDAGYCQSTNPQTACIENGGFWNSSSQSCETVPTCSNGEQYDPQTNTCNVPVSDCVNLDPNPIILSYIATDNSEVENLVLKPLSSYEYLAHQGCAYIIKTPPSNLDCFTSINDPSPKKGYCQQDYEPTFQDATNQVQAFTNLVKSTPDTCVGDEQGNQFGNCLLICNANEFRNDVTSTCDPKPTCDANQTYNATNNSCENNSCPAGQYRPTVNDPCQDEPTCKDGELSFQGSCVVQACPDGQYRTATGNDCVNIPVDQTYSTCEWSNIDTWLSSDSQVSQCTKDTFNTYVNPNTNKCMIFNGFHDTSSNLDCQFTQTKTANYWDTYCNTYINGVLASTLSTNQWQCANKTLANKGYINRNNFPTTPQFYQSPALATCPQNTSILANGFCQPDSCIANPNQSICNTGGSSGGGTTSADLTETNNLLNGTADIPDLDTKVSDYFQNLSNELDFETDANGFAVIHEDYAAQFDNFMENSGINAIYEQYEEINPLSQIVDAQCSYNVEWDGKNYSISICDEQDDIHTVISFMLFISLLFGLRDLIFERPQ
jgi:hypothetical protein